jgi:hypothetical protein
MEEERNNMKTRISIAVLTVVVVLCLVLATGKTAAKACTTVPGSDTNDTWVVETTDAAVVEIPMDQVVPAAPADQQLASPGLTLSGASKICFPFSGGQFGWVGQIRMNVDGEWVSLPTTTSWLPDEEGSLWACAQAPSAGTFALFAYWQHP